ncbi:SpoVG family protein [Singulisphaera sp. PoT]|uniref:SpoVG family protein n=1 Tax=Singulisphaera sp. PoT TaxID=3411797 RepID=UPI003BF5D3E0
MRVTEVRIKLAEGRTDRNERLRAFCSITLDGMFVVRDLKVIESSIGGMFVAMPSRKLTDRCHHCGTKNHMRSRFCNNCGVRQDEHRATRHAMGQAKLHADVSHPINAQCRSLIQRAVIEAYLEELELAKRPGYVSRYEELDLEYEAAGPAMRRSA